MDQRSSCDVDEEAALEMSDGEDRGKQGHFTAGDQVEMEVEANEKEDGGGDGGGGGKQDGQMGLLF